MQVPLYIVDAFTDRPFTGNPAAVCLLDAPVADDWMGRVAAEMNLSETAFLLPHPDGWRLRWFTPLVEVDLCGHATLASAHVLLARGEAASGNLVFHTRSGPLKASDSERTIALDFPALPADPADPPASLLAALRPGGTVPRPVAAGHNGTDWLIELSDEAEVRGLSPDFRALGAEAVSYTHLTLPTTPYV
jgi:PhzF family phenazine biosynthesis protein